MKFEEIIKTISKWVASIVVFFIAGGLYLSAKGFVMGPDGTPVLVKQAQASMFEKEDPAPKKISKDIVLPDNRFLGKKNAPVTIYEYSSFGCFHCAEFHLKTLPQIKQEYIDTGLVKIVFEPFPLDKKSMQAAMISECIADDKYYQFVELMFRKQREWGLSTKAEQIMSQYAVLSGLSADKVKGCLTDDNMAKTIISDQKYAVEKLGIQGTPSFVITKGDDREIIFGAPSLEKLQGILDEKLGRPQKK